MIFDENMKILMYTTQSYKINVNNLQTYLNSWFHLTNHNTELLHHKWDSLVYTAH